MTIGVQFFVKPLKVYGKKKAIIFWDLAGVDRYRKIHSDFIQGAKAGILAFDLTRPTSLDNIEQRVDLFRTYDPNLPIILLGMKGDLHDHIRVDVGNIDQIVREMGMCDYIKVSAKTGQNIGKAFRSLYYHIFAHPNLRNAGYISEEGISLWSDINIKEYKMTPFRIKQKIIQEHKKKKDPNNIQEQISLIKARIFELEYQFTRLHVSEIKELCNIYNEDLLFIVIQDMIAKREIKAHFFLSTQSLVFNKPQSRNKNITWFMWIFFFCSISNLLLSIIILMFILG